MRSRFDNGSSKSQDVECMGKVVIRNIRIRFVSDDSLRVWLDKYGKIEETKIYSNCAVVKFSSDLEAAGAVQCEDGIRRFGSIASVKHAEPEILRALERTEPLRVSDYQGSAANSGSESRSRRRRSPPGDNDSSRPRKRSASPRNSSSQSRKVIKGSVWLLCLSMRSVKCQPTIFECIRHSTIQLHFTFSCNSAVLGCLH
ncbi:unnamed protein product [Schistocephalus solidus]|uniref:RRM domain-containing protein n=1 Tax=Schistocephalus solidus TaxID=70667 RepID=A0A183TQZ8_SCHSO|nr:unnamed protein product [Schistocephalus solidus]